MADQNTTIAQLPAGYATLAGVIYAVAATSPKVWSYIAWTRMSAIFMKRAQRVDTIKTRQSSNTSPNQLAELQAGLSETVIQQLRQLRLPDSSVVAKHIAVMHVICSNAQNDSFSTGREDDININDPEAQRHLRARSVDGSGNEPPPTSSAQFPPIDVDIHGLRTPISTTTVTLTVDEVRQGATKVVDLTDAFMLMCLKQANTDQFSRRVHAQAAAPFKAVVIELVYKAIEVLIACGIILGSSGGAWLGLTLASMFPQRIAAGLFISSCGQVLSRKRCSSLSKPHVWRPPGTVWTETGAHPYAISATTSIPDHWRDAIGYWLQYLALVVVQRYKLQIRDALQFGPYRITRDAIRYILLVIELFILIICGIIVRENIKRSRRNIIAGTVYLATLSMGLTCVILGQKSFLKPVWKFYLTSRIVDPIAAIGSVAAMNVDLQEGGRVPPEKWVLFWAMGACTVVCDGSSKKRLLKKIGEKVIIFVTLSGQMALYHAIFQKLQIPSACLTASLKGPEKAALISAFNSGDQTMALTGNFHGMGTGFNLQESYQWVLFADGPPSEPIEAQIGARVHRLSVPSPAEAVTHYAPKSINDRQIKNNGTKVVRAILEQRMDVPGSFGAVGSDREEDGSAGEEEDNGEDVDEDDLN